jgi:hypothetical protein
MINAKVFEAENEVDGTDNCVEHDDIQGRRVQLAITIQWSVRNLPLERCLHH